jgi:hypothetical protein
MRYVGVLLIALAQLWSTAYAADAETYRYRDNESVPVGSNIPRSVTLSSKLPFDRSFAELTPEQKALVRGQYNNLNDPDAPPWPESGLRTIFKELNRDLINLRAKVEPGRVMAVARVDERGQVQSVQVYKTPNDAATAAVSRALVHVPFKPAMRDGKPVAMDFLLDVTIEK